MGPLPEAVGGGVRRARQKCCVLEKNYFKTKEKTRNSRNDDTRALIQALPAIKLFLHYFQIFAEIQVQFGLCGGCSLVFAHDTYKRSLFLVFPEFFSPSKIYLFIYFLFSGPRL